jgi:glucosamine-6-phosphate deaminase
MNSTFSKDNILAWCSVPVDELAGRDDLKAKLAMHPDRESTMKYVGNLMAEEVIQNNSAGKITKWVLPAGPMDEYDTFIARVNQERISLKGLHIFHMDEFLDWEGRPYPVGDTYESLEGTMNAGFYARIDPELNVPVEQRFWPRINDIDRIDQKVEELGGIDTVWAGVGARGLVAFCESPRSYWHNISIEEFAKSKTRIVEINPDTIVALSQRTFGACYDRVPPRSITIGFKVMLSAKRTVMMIATGTWKQTVLRVILFSEPTLEYPVTLFTKYVPNVILACDRNTADHPLSHTIRGW